MATATFYTTEALNSDQRIYLSEQESLHAIKSRRLSVGQGIQLINGQGQLAQAEIAEVNKKQVAVNVGSIKTVPQPACSLTIATAIPKGDRQKVMLDMMTQLGVSKIVPLECEYSVTRFSHNMFEKWQRVCIEACKQSQQAWLPEIALPQSLQSFVIHELESEAKVKKILFADLSGSTATEIDVTSVSEIVILIGPEGGFSATEINFLRSQKLDAITLGSAILRTETACVAAAAVFV